MNVQIQISVSPEDWNAIYLASKLTGETPTDFVSRTASEEADGILVELEYGKLNSLKAANPMTFIPVSDGGMRSIIQVRGFSE